MAPTRLVEVSETRFRGAVDELERTLGRRPTADEIRETAESLADQEVLLAYAVDLGLDREPVAKRRLEQIAQFISGNPNREGEESPDLAKTAAELGLREQDLVTRRLLIDGARRLIRAGALVREPSDQVLAEYLAANPQEFALDARVRMTQIRFAGEAQDDRAKSLLFRLRSEGTPLDSASELGDPGVLPGEFPLLTEREIERRLGKRFVAQLREVPLGVWSGPLNSRSNTHLVYVHERTPAQVPVLDQVRSQVRAKVRQKAADEWLALRVEFLRKQYGVVAPTLAVAETL